MPPIPPIISQHSHHPRRALFRAAAGYRRFRLLFPMRETVDQGDFVPGRVAQTNVLLRAVGRKLQRHFEPGLIIETPAVAWNFSEWLKVADFISIGTNDLVQCLFAVKPVCHMFVDMHQTPCGAERDGARLCFRSRSCQVRFLNPNEKGP